MRSIERQLLQYLRAKGYVVATLTSGWNPFQNIDLLFPHESESIKDLTQSGGGSGSGTTAPFPRMVDAWLLAVSLGTQNQGEHFSYSPPSRKFVTGAVLQKDTRAIYFLHHVALSVLLTDPEFESQPEEAAYEVVKNPHRVIKIANDLAARGYDDLMKLIQGNNPEVVNGVKGLITRFKSSSDDVNGNAAD